MLKKNIGKQDRLIRLGLACILAAGALYTKSIILGIAALFVLVEALFSWCLFYQMIGRNTCPKDR